MAVTLPGADATISIECSRLAVSDLLVNIGELRAHPVDLVVTL